MVSTWPAIDRAKICGNPVLSITRSSVPDPHHQCCRPRANLLTDKLKTCLTCGHLKVSRHLAAMVQCFRVELLNVGHVVQILAPTSTMPLTIHPAITLPCASYLQLPLQFQLPPNATKWRRRLALSTWQTFRMPLRRRQHRITMFPMASLSVTGPLHAPSFSEHRLMASFPSSIEDKSCRLQRVARHVFTMSVSHQH